LTFHKYWGQTHDHSTHFYFHLLVILCSWRFIRCRTLWCSSETGSSLVTIKIHKSKNRNNILLVIKKIIFHIFVDDILTSRKHVWIWPPLVSKTLYQPKWLSLTHEMKAVHVECFDSTRMPWHFSLFSFHLCFSQSLSKPKQHSKFSSLFSEAGGWNLKMHRSWGFTEAVRVIRCPSVTWMGASLLHSAYSSKLDWSPTLRTEKKITNTVNPISFIGLSKKPSWSLRMVNRFLVIFRPSPLA